MLLPPLAPDATFAPLVLDSDEPQARRWRMTSSLEELRMGDTRGAISCSGSAQFSLDAWDDIQERLGRPSPEALYVLDLRQESHGFLDRAAISWYAQHNWGCVGLARDEALQLEVLRLRLLERGESVWVGDARAVKEGTGQRLTEWKPTRARTEQEALGLRQGHYLRLPVTDHSRPEDAVLDHFIHFVQGLRGDVHLHFHCRGGKGRTSLFLALQDLLWNAVHLPLEAILDRQQRLNEYDLRKVPAADSYKAPFVAQRLDLLTRFHGYARANPGGRPQSWTQWLRSQQPTPA